MQTPRALRVPGTGDAGDVVVGWLVRLVAVLSAVGVLAFDGVSLGAAELAVTDTAAAAARAAGRELGSGATAQQAYLAAQETAWADHALNEVPVDTFVIAPDLGVSLLVRRSAPTMVLHLLPGSDGWLTAEATATSTAGWAAP